MTDYSETAPARLATRAAFFAAGFAIACWAPLIPFAKTRVGADEAQFGLLLLCLGIGSLIAMPVTGVVSARAGARPMVIMGGFGLVVMLPFLALAPTQLTLALTLLVIGASMGTLDVSMNVHAAKVESIENRPLMSGFHAQFSLGNFVGAGVMIGLLSMGLGPVSAILVGAALTLVAMLICAPRLMRARGEAPEPFALPRGVVLLIAVLAGISFLVEGAMLDWGALLLIDRELALPENAGLGFMLFSVAMVIARLTGDWTIARLGQFPTLLIGGIVTVIGLIVILMAPGATLALSGFVLVGLGAANVVPVLFSLAGRQKIMPPGLAIASVTITGYAGILLGPAIIGFAADWTSLPIAFWALVILMAVVPLTARAVTRA